MNRPRFGIALVAAVPEMIRTAVLVERLGYDSMWTPDETVGYEMEYGRRAVVPDAFTSLTAIALKTKKLLLGTSVVDALIRPPVKTAQITATLDSLSHGRFLLGIGGSEAGNHDPFGVPTDHPLTRLHETVDVVRLLWNSNYEHRANFNGAHYRLKEAYLRIRPFRSNGPPIYIAAFGPKMLSLVGKVGDGWIPFGHTPETYSNRLKGPITRSLANAGRSLHDIDPACIVPASISRDGRKARRAAIAIGKAYLVWSVDNLRSLLPDLNHPGIRQTQLKTLSNLSQLTELSKKVPDDVAYGVTVSGTKQDCTDQIKKFIEAGCRHLILAPVASSETKRSQILKQFSMIVSKF